MKAFNQLDDQTFKMGFFTIPVKLYTLVSLLLVAQVGVVLFTVSTLEKQKQDGGVINLAGKQRMLTQKLSKAIMELQLGNTAKSEEVSAIKMEFEKVLDGLNSGNAELNLPAAETPEIRGKLDATKEKWTPLAEQVDILNQG